MIQLFLPTISLQALLMAQMATSWKHQELLLVIDGKCLVHDSFLGVAQPVKLGFLLTSVIWEEALSWQYAAEWFSIDLWILE